MNRRSFFYTGAAAAASGTTLSASVLAAQDKNQKKQDKVTPFKRDWRLKYAPRLDWGPGNLMDRVERIASYGFTGTEYNGLGRRKMPEVEALRKKLDETKVDMGIFVANWKGRTLARKETKDAFLADLKHTLEVHKVIGNKFCTTLAGNIQKGMSHEEQTQNCIDNLKHAADLLEGTDLTLVVEPLNPYNHRGYFVVTSPHAYEIMKGVGSKHVKILFDIFHQQRSEGNLIHNINRFYDEIAYFQVGDSPARKEPLTGEINYRRVFQAIHKKGYKGFLGMEHGLSKRGLAGLHKCFKSYEWCDSW